MKIDSRELLTGLCSLTIKDGKLINATEIKRSEKIQRVKKEPMNKTELKENVKASVSLLGFDVEVGDAKSLVNNTYNLLTALERHISLVEKLNPSEDRVADLYAWLMTMCTENFMGNAMRAYKDKPYKHAPFIAFVDVIHAIFRNLEKQGIFKAPKESDAVAKEPDGLNRTPSGLFIPNETNAKDIN